MQKGEWLSFSRLFSFCILHFAFCISARVCRGGGGVKPVGSPRADLRYIRRPTLGYHQTSGCYPIQRLRRSFRWAGIIITALFACVAKSGHILLAY